MERKAKGTQQQGGKGRTQQTQAPRVFFQKQKMGTRCRMHALNNALGRAAIGVEGFNAACDAFDARYGLSGSRLYFLLADVSPRPPPPALEPTDSPPKNESGEAENEDGGSENEKETREGSEEKGEEEEDDHNEEGMIDDVLSYILRERFRYRTKYIPMGGKVNRLHREELNQCEAFLSFSAGHVWANRRVGHTWYAPLHAQEQQLGPAKESNHVDGRPTPIKPNKALAAGLGHILIYAKSGQGGPKQTSAAQMESNRSAKKTKQRAKEDRGKRAPGEEHRKGTDVARVETRDDDDDDEEESEEGEQEAQLLTPTTNPFDCLGDE